MTQTSRPTRPSAASPQQLSRHRLISRKRLGLACALVIVAAGVVFLIGNGSLSLWDRDEPRYAQCSREMLLGAPGPAAAPNMGHPPDWVVPHFLGAWRTAKPPLIYWAQALAMSFLGDNSFAARLPSALAMLATLIILARVLWKNAGPNRAFWTVFILSSNTLTIMAAKMCMTDAMLTLWTTIAQLCLYAIWRGSRAWSVTLTFWIAIALAGLTKGPIVLAVELATMIALGAFDYAETHARSRSPACTCGALQLKSAIWRLLVNIVAGCASSARQWWLRTRPLVGLSIVALITAPWLILLHHRAPGFLQSLMNDGVHHATSGTENHSGPPGYYLISVIATFFPWSLFLVTALVISWKHRQLPQIRFALAALIGPWIFQEIIRTKLPFYVMPEFPALAFLTADALIRCFRGQHDDLAKPAFRNLSGVWAAIIVLLGLAPWLLAAPPFHLGPLHFPDLQLGRQPLVVMAIISAFALIYAATLFSLFRVHRFISAAIACGIGAMTLLAVVLAVYLPSANFLRISNQLAQSLIRHGAVNPGEVVMAGYKEPSLAFYQGGTIREAKCDEYLRKTPRADWAKWLVLPQTEWQRTPAALRAEYDVVDQVRGLDYAGSVNGTRLPTVLILKRKL